MTTTYKVCLVCSKAQHLSGFKDSHGVGVL